VRLFRFPLLLCLSLPLAVGGCSKEIAPGAPKGRLGVYYWANTVWPERWAAMLELAPDDIFIKAGTVERTGQGFRFLPPVVRGILPLPRGMRVHAVMHHRVLGRGEAARVAEALPMWIAAAQSALSRGGLALSGIQFDLEGDWDVRDYPDLLARLSLPNSFTRSAFVSPHQISNMDCAAALDAFDRVAVGSYDFSWDLEGFRPVDIPWTAEFIRRMFLKNDSVSSTASRGKNARADRIWLVAPIYGAVSVLDPSGRARIPFIEFSSPESWRPFVQADRSDGGRELFRVEKTFTVKDVTIRAGERLSFWKPDTRRLGNELQAAQSRIPGLHGVALFSWPAKTNTTRPDGEILRMARAARR
jgi:hypothetical protein